MSWKRALKCGSDRFRVHFLSKISPAIAYPFRMLVAFRAISAWRQAIRPDPIVLLHWKHKLMQCISCQDVDSRQRTVPTVMWNSLVFPIWAEKNEWIGKIYVARKYRINGNSLQLKTFGKLTCVPMSRTSNMNDCANPPLKPSIHRIPSDVIEIFVMVQLCTWSGRPGTNTCIQLFCYWIQLVT